MAKHLGGNHANDASANKGRIDVEDENAHALVIKASTRRVQQIDKSEGEQGEQEQNCDDKHLAVNGQRHS